MLAGALIGAALLALRPLLEHKRGKLQSIAIIAIGSVIAIAASYALAGFGYAQFQSGFVLRAERAQFEKTTVSGE